MQLFLLERFLKAFSAGWIYGIEKQVESLGSNIVFAYIGVTFGSVLVACGMWFGLGNVAAGFSSLIFFYGTGMVAMRTAMATYGGLRLSSSVFQNRSQGALFEGSAAASRSRQNHDARRQHKIFP